ncbi:hypothetical protein B0H63DRAFT_406551 [Podospora didyma]|uniref:Uncharacterized protein n=1 Tax=Podospora didyma TaxID=330526 RepID=A0AAE0P4W5_9PEZI|nr:hypothetical protein B0H63DRAFT_406551 [Podospora didyma]
MPSLPLQAKIAIRDKWENGDALQSSLKNLAAIIGLPVVIEPEWHLLLAELDTFYGGDRALLVTSIVNCVVDWTTAISEIIEDDSLESWTELLLEAVSGRVLIFLEVSDKNTSKMSTSWSEARQGFIITLPKKQLDRSDELLPTFRGNLLACFGGGGVKDESALEQSHTTEAEAEDDWANVVKVEASGKVVEEPTRAVQEATATTTRVKTKTLPKLESLPRPDELFKKAPYYLTIGGSSDEIHVEGSHSPSLKLLADYLTRWCRVNHQDSRKPPAVQVILKQSAFALGEWYDLVVLTTKETRYSLSSHVSVATVAAFVEGVLEYDRISTQGGSLMFRRDVAFQA